ncbi:21 kDa protein [Phtheirospermum japonicum]|uniref:21 kDa protein n=1 Tax=Phtheirospermum japonicum TaxID=374723 RepID=A0A830BQE1_9LAMI|nr:21 kDa protein [Phtheirospermum japonicum]
MEGSNITTKPSLNHLLKSLTLLFLIYPHPISCSTVPVPKTYTNFIKKSCRATTYPSLCLKNLSKYAAAVKASKRKLCTAALAVAMQSARNCTSTVSTLAKRKGISRPEARAVKDCMGDLKDAVYHLKQTVSAMGRLRGPGRRFQWDNAKTYASAAITDADTCVDGFLGRRVSRSVRTKIKGCVSDVERLTSNALYLINHLY